MKSIEKLIVEKLQEHTFDIGAVSISEPFSYKKPDLTVPLIIVQELINTPDEARETDKEVYSDLVYQISVISRTSVYTDGGVTKTRSPYETVVDLSMEVCDFLRKELMLSRMGDFITRPYTSDNTVMERVFRVTAKYDLEHEYLYRR